MAIAGTLLAGTASVTIDGLPYMMQGDLLWSPSTIERETLVGMDGIHGFKETPRACFMEFTLRDADNIIVGAFDGLVNSTVVAQLANGKLVIGRNMWTVEHREVNSVEATFKARLEGPFVEEG
jgi:Phage tail tube protein